MCRPGRVCECLLNWPASISEDRYFLEMKKRRLDPSQIAKLPPGIPPDIPIAKHDSRNRLTMPQEILDRKGFKAGDNIGFKIDEYNVVTLMHVDNPIMNLRGAGGDLYKDFDLEKEREFSWGDRP